jgi:hypothetical protein
LAAASSWRRQMAEKYPGDPRNGPAAELLSALCNDTKALPLGIVDAVAACSGVRAAASEVARQIGFVRFPETFADVVAIVIERVAEQDAEIERVFSREGGAR